MSHELLGTPSAEEEAITSVGNQVYALLAEAESQTAILARIELLLERLCKSIETKP